MRIQIKLPKHLEDAGVPTFEQFCKNPKRYRKNAEETFEAVDEGGHAMRHLMHSMTYEIFGYKCTTLEEVQRIASSQGFQIDHLEAKPQAIPEPGGSGSAPKCRMHVVFEPKSIYTMK